jgi:hypothetical protein
MKNEKWFNRRSSPTIFNRAARVVVTESEDRSVFPPNIDGAIRFRNCKFLIHSSKGSNIATGVLETAVSQANWQSCASVPQLNLTEEILKAVLHKKEP